MRDEFGGTLDEGIAERRMKDLFHFYGQSFSDVAFGAALSFSVDPDVWLKDIDRVLLFLCKQGNLPPDWVEAQDITRQNQLVAIVCEQIEAAHGKSDLTEGDSPKEWL